MISNQVANKMQARNCIFVFKLGNESVHHYIEAQANLTSRKINCFGCWENACFVHPVRLCVLFVQPNCFWETLFLLRFLLSFCYFFSQSSSSSSFWFLFSLQLAIRSKAILCLCELNIVFVFRSKYRKIERENRIIQQTLYQYSLENANVIQMAFGLHFKIDLTYPRLLV